MPAKNRCLTSGRCHIPITVLCGNLTIIPPWPRKSGRGLVWVIWNKFDSIGSGFPAEIKCVSFRIKTCPDIQTQSLICIHIPRCRARLNCDGRLCVVCFMNGEFGSFSNFPPLIQPVQLELIFPFFQVESGYRPIHHPITFERGLRLSLYDNSVNTRSRLTFDFK